MMNLIDQACVLEQAKEYTNSQRICESKKKVLTWDGNTEGRANLLPLMGVNLYHVSDEVIDLNTVTRFQMSSGEWFDIASLEAQIDALSTGSALAGTDPATVYFFVLPEELVGTDVDPDRVFPKGTYFLWTEESYFSAIEYEEVKQIDPKFIPGYIPFVKLVLEPEDPSAADTDVVLTQASKEALTAVMNNPMPICAKISFSNLPGFSHTTMFAKSIDGFVIAYESVSSSLPLGLVYIDNDWSIDATSSVSLTTLAATEESAQKEE